MSRSMFTITQAVCLCLMLFISLAAQQRTVGLMADEGGREPGYILFSPVETFTAYLIDEKGFQINAWETPYRPGVSYELLPDGHLLRAADQGGNPRFNGAGGGGGRLEKYDWDGNLVWFFEHSNDSVRLHHDMLALPNGNILAISWELRTTQQAIDAGRNPSGISDGDLWPEKIIEIEPILPEGGNIVWEWHVWDHLVQDIDSTKANFGVIADHPELIDINYYSNPGHDWLHANSLTYNPHLDQILISLRNLDEFWIIDHSTTTEEAAGHTGGNRGKGGDILYRWGNPQTYGAGDDGDQKTFSQHHCAWIDSGLVGEGNILIFNNGGGRPGPDYTSIMEIIPPVDALGNYAALTAGQAHGPTGPIWEYTDPEDPASFYASFLSSMQRLPNGNTLICSGPHGDIFEIDDTDQTIWRYVSPAASPTVVAQGGSIPDGAGGGTTNSMFRAIKYPRDYSAFDGKVLSRDSLIEHYTTNAYIDISIDSDLLPIPAAGDTIPYKITIWNTSAAQVDMMMWVDILPPDGPAQPVMTAKNLKRQPLTVISKSPLVRISATKPAGDYSLKAYFAASGDTSCTTFDFEKLGVLNANAPASNFQATIENRLFDNHPNPFNPTTMIRYFLDQNKEVRLKVYDTLGRLVSTLVDRPQFAGYHTAVWDGKDASGTEVASGVYIYQLTAGSFTTSKRMTLLR